MTLEKFLAELQKAQARLDLLEYHRVDFVVKLLPYKEVLVKVEIDTKEFHDSDWTFWNASVTDLAKLEEMLDEIARYDASLPSLETAKRARVFRTIETLKDNMVDAGIEDEGLDALLKKLKEDTANLLPAPF